MLKCVVLLIAIIQISASSQITSSTLGYKQLLQTDFQSDYKTQIIKSNNEDHVKVLLSSRGSKSNDWTQKTSNKFLMDSKKIKIFDESERNPKILTFRSKPFLNKIDLKEEKMITNNKVESLDPKSRSFNRFSIISNRKLNLPGIRSSSSFSTTNFSPGVVIRDNFNSLKDVKNIVKKFAKHFNTKRKIGFVLMTRNRLYEEGQRRKKTLLIGKAKWIVKKKSCSLHLKKYKKWLKTDLEKLQRFCRVFNCIIRKDSKGFSLFVKWKCCNDSKILKKKFHKCKLKTSKVRRSHKKKANELEDFEFAEDEIQITNMTSFTPSDRVLKSFNDSIIISRMMDNLAIPSFLFSTDLTNNFISYALSGNQVRFNVYDNILTVNCRNITLRDLQPRDYIVSHVIDGLLYNVDDNVVGILQKRSHRFSSLLYVLEKLNMVDDLSSLNRTTTIFAPTDSALQSLPLSVRLESKECLKEIIENHIVDEMFCSPATEINFRFKTRRGSYLRSYFESSSRSSFVNGTKLIKPDIVAVNGVVHIVKNLLFRANYLSDILHQQKDFSYFYKSLQSANLINELSSRRNISLIVPQNSAFQKLTEVELIRATSDLEIIHQNYFYHMIPLLDLNQLTSRETIWTVRGQKKVHVAKYMMSNNQNDERTEIITFQCAKVSSVKNVLTSCAGSLIIIDQIMNYPKIDLLSVLTEDKSFSIILSVIKKHSLQMLFQSDEDLTFFAPTNEVFERSASFVIDELFANPETSRRIISFHFIDGFWCKDQLLQKTKRHQTRNGQTLMSCPKHNRVLLGKHGRKLRATILESDKLASNGIVHRINNLLLPNFYNAIQYPSPR